MSALEAVVAAHQRWLHLPDPRALLAILGTVAANRLESDPVWLLLVGPPGGGKSELLHSLSALPDVYPAATLTEASLLSGTAKKERDKTAKGGLLREIGDFGILVHKDFTSVLAMHSETRAALLAALREVYDGSWTRHVGTDGGRTLHWRGKVGLIAGCTPTIDKHHAVVAAMGERFVCFRFPNVDADEQARRSFAHAGREREMRTELAETTAALFASPLQKPKPLDEAEQDLLFALSTLVVRCRSAVERDGRTREIELIPEPEAPARLVVVLSRLLAGLDAIGLDRKTSWRVLGKVGLDSMPAIRLAVIETLFAAGEVVSTPNVSSRLGYPDTTTRRALQDLAAHRVVNCYPQGKGRSDVWELNKWTHQRYVQVRSVPEISEGEPVRSAPEMSGDVVSLFSKELNDFSETVVGAG